MRHHPPAAEHRVASVCHRVLTESLLSKYVSFLLHVKDLSFMFTRTVKVSSK